MSLGETPITPCMFLYFDHEAWLVQPNDLLRYDVIYVHDYFLNKLKYKKYLSQPTKAQSTKSKYFSQSQRVNTVPIELKLMIFQTFSTKSQYHFHSAQTYDFPFERITSYHLTTKSFDIHTIMRIIFIQSGHTHKILLLKNSLYFSNLNVILWCIVTLFGFLYESNFLAN